jgi:predicted cupin superfamily sugar epimerase
MSTPGADFWIRHLQLTKHIEGGWYNEVYRSALVLHNTQLPSNFPGTRNTCTHIYFLLKWPGFSAFHRIKSDELWHFYFGEALIVYEIDESGQLTEHRLGTDPEKGESFFCVIKAGNWFASRVAYGGDYGLVGCTVSPGFDFEDFEMADKKTLLNVYPQHVELINQLAVDI